MIVVVQNDPDVPVGSYGDQLESSGLAWLLVRAFAGEPLPGPGRVGAAIILGGAMGVHDTADCPFLFTVQGFMANCLRDRIPLLGICLGGQLLASLAGATVHSGRCGEKGVLPVSLTDAGRADPLFAGILPEFLTFQWHDDTFELPAGAMLLASSSVCPRQAFRLGACAYGLQFHPEVTPAIVGAWARETAETGSRWKEYVASFNRHAEAYRAPSERLLANFLSLAREV